MQDFSPPYGEIEEISPLIRRITAPNPSLYTFKGTGTYIIGRGDVAVIDPGPNMSTHHDAIITELGDEKITHILVTHNHKDHSPCARPLASSSGAKIYAFDVGNQLYSAEEVEEGLDKDFFPDVILKNNDEIKSNNWTIDVVHTPGHLSNHICFGLREEKALFTGDHVMGWSTTLISPPDGSMQDYYNSLNMMMTRDDKRYYPTHGLPIENPLSFIKNTLEHRLSRDQEIMHALEGQRYSIKDLIGIVYPNLNKNLHDAARRTILAHLIRLVALGELESDGQPSESSIYYRKQ
ncbi:MAG: MBL fold metallo-hydrolase [Kordiimonadaceae bacterium]|nr:MBL fold metallo-hydrolase [Kordiimonadaceae bacterium]